MDVSMGAEPAETIKSRRLTRDDWLNAARRTLVKSGIDDVKVDRLAKKLKASRGSFYWHFKSHAELLQALLQDWEVRNQVVVVQTRDRWEDAAPDMADIGDVFLRENTIWLDPEINWATQSLAMRLWARKSKLVAKAVLRVDQTWLDLLTEMFRRSGYSERESRVRARVNYFHYLGHYSFVTDDVVREMEELRDTYYHVLVGGEPSDRYRQVMEEGLAIYQKKKKPRRSKGAKQA